MNEIRSIPEDIRSGSRWILTSGYHLPIFCRCLIHGWSLSLLEKDHRTRLARRKSCSRLGIDSSITQVYGLIILTGLVETELVTPNPFLAADTTWDCALLPNFKPERIFGQDSGGSLSWASERYTMSMIGILGQSHMAYAFSISPHKRDVTSLRNRPDSFYALTPISWLSSLSLLESHYGQQAYLNEPAQSAALVSTNAFVSATIWRVVFPCTSVNA